MRAVPRPGLIAMYGSPHHVSTADSRGFEPLHRKSPNTPPDSIRHGAVWDLKFALSEFMSHLISPVLSSHQLQLGNQILNLHIKDHGR